MTIERLSARLDDLERRIEQLGSNGVSSRWWEEQAGRFKDDPEFDEIVRLGRAYRQAENRRARRDQRAHARH